MSRPRLTALCFPRRPAHRGSRPSGAHFPFGVPVSQGSWRSKTLACAGGRGPAEVRPPEDATLGPAATTSCGLSAAPGAGLRLNNRTWVWTPPGDVGLLGTRLGPWLGRVGAETPVCPVCVQKPSTRPQSTPKLQSPPRPRLPLPLLNHDSQGPGAVRHPWWRALPRLPPSCPAASPTLTLDAHRF